MNRLMLAAIAALLVLSACAKSPYTNRTQLMLISQGQELALGGQAARQVLAKERISPDGAQAERMGLAGARIAEVAGRPDFQWEFTLIDKPKEKNAFCLPGGKVFVYSGILELTPTDDELATVLAHEIAHALARHGAERMSIGLAAQLGGQIAGMALSFSSPVVSNVFSQAYGLGTQVGVILPYSREQEFEADEIGLILMAKAGFDPAAALGFWQRMSAQEKGQGSPSWLATHPPSRERIKAIERNLPAIKREFYRPRPR